MLLKEQAYAFNELQRMTASADCAVKYYETVNNIDVQYLLPQVNVPTFASHVRGDLMQPFEEGRKLAATIPGRSALWLYKVTTIVYCPANQQR